MKKIIIAITLLIGSTFLSCHQFKNKEQIDVRYELVDNNRQLVWSLNDGKYTYLIQYHFNSRKLENQLVDTETVQIADSSNIIGTNPKSYNEVVKHNYKALINDKTKNEVEFNKLIVSNKLHYYYTQRENFTMPYEIQIEENYIVKVNIEAGKNYPLKYAETDYAGGYEFKLEPKDVMLYRMIQSKLSKESIKSDTISELGYGHQIVIDNHIIINNPKVIYDNKDLSSIIMFTDYIILKYIPVQKPEKFIYPIVTKRKPLEPETAVY